MKHVLSLTAIFTLTIIVCIASVTYAQESIKFATKGTSELGGSISFQSITPVSNGKTGDATSIFTIAPYFGSFLTDGLEMGLTLGITSIREGGSTLSNIMIFVAPSYNFKTGGIAYPFIEALGGYTGQSLSGSSEGASGFSWGGRAGVKLAVTAKGLFVLGVQYLQITENPSRATERYGANQLSISAGFTVWL
jgi:hypothetical protein